MTTPTTATKRRRIQLRHAILAAFVILVAVGIWWYWAGSPKTTLETDAVAHAVAFSPDGTLLATGSSPADRPEPDGIIRLWDVATMRQSAKWVAHRGFIVQLAFDSEGKTLNSAAIVGSRSPQREVKVWDVATRKEIGSRTIDDVHPGFQHVSPTGKLVAKHGGWKVLIMSDAVTGEELYRIEGDSRQLNCAAFSGDGTLLATAGGDTTGGGPSPIPFANGDLRIWEVSTGRLLRTSSRHGAPIEGVAFSPDGQTVATAGLDGKVKLWAVPQR